MLPFVPMLADCAPHVAPSTMTAIVRTESGGQPNAIGLKKLRYQPADQQQAVRWARWLQSHGYIFDAGLMQVNVRNWSKYGLTAETVFDPCTNLRVGAQILAENYHAASLRYGLGSRALAAALSAYNTGNFRDGFYNGYVQRVQRNAGLPLAAGADVPHPDRPPRSDVSARAIPSAPYSAPSTVAGFADALSWEATTSGH
jgi:type IV secretion system protein VirB1